MRHRQTGFHKVLSISFIMSMIMTLFLANTALAGVVYMRNPDGSFLINPTDNSKVVDIRYGLMGGFVRSDNNDGIYEEFDARKSSNFSKYYGKGSVFMIPRLDVRQEVSTKDIGGFGGPVAFFFGFATVKNRDAVTGEVTEVEDTFIEDDAADLNVLYLGETLPMEPSDDPYEDLRNMKIPVGQAMTPIKGNDFFEEVPGERNNGLLSLKDPAPKLGYYLINRRLDFSLLQDRSIDRADEMMLLHIVDYTQVELADANFSEETGVWTTSFFFTQKNLEYQNARYKDEPYIFQVRDIKGYENTTPKAGSLVMTYYGYDDGDFVKPQELPKSAIFKAVDAVKGIYSFSTRCGGTYLFTMGSPFDASVRENGFIIEVEDGFGGLKFEELSFSSGKETYVRGSDREQKRTLFVESFYGKAIEVYEYRDDEQYRTLTATDLEVTYYGDTKDDPKSLKDDGTFIPGVKTNAALEDLKEPHDGNVLFFTPDQEGVYLISKKGISDEVTTENTKIREGAILVKAYFNEPGFYESMEGGTTSANLAKGCKGGVTKLYIDHMKGTEETRTVYVYSKYAFYKGEVGRDQIKSDYTMEGDASNYAEFAPVEGKEGWYKLTLKLTEVNDYKWVRLIFDKFHLYNLLVYVNVYEKNNWYYRTEDSTSYKTAADINHNYWRLHRDYLVSLGRTDQTGFHILKGEELSAFRFYYELSDDEQLKRYDPETREYILKEGEIRAGGTILTSYDDVTTEVVLADGVEYLKLKSAREGSIALYNGEKLIIICDMVKSDVIFSTTSNVPGYGEPRDPFVEHLGVVYEGVTPNPLYLIADYNNTGTKPYGIDLSSVKIFPTYEVEDVDYPCDEFITVDKEHPVMGNAYYNTRDIAVGYPVLFTDKIDRPFDIRVEYQITNQTSTSNLYYYYMQLRSLSFVKYPEKRDYQAGELFDATGLEVKGSYRGVNSSSVITLDPSLFEITISGEPAATHKLTDADTDVVFSFLGKKIKCAIWVAPGKEEGTSQGQDDPEKDPVSDGKDGAGDGREVVSKDGSEAAQEAEVGTEVFSVNKNLGYMIFEVIKKGDAKNVPQVALKGLRGKQIPKKIVMPNTITAENGIVYQVTKIKARAFAGQKKIRKIDLSKMNNLSIDAKAFYRDKGLKEIRVKAGALKKINKKAFTGLKKKTKVIVICEGKTKKAARKKFVKAGKKLKAAKARKIVFKFRKMKKGK